MKIPKLDCQAQTYNGGIQEDPCCSHATETNLTHLPTCLRTQIEPKLFLMALTPSLGGPQARNKEPTI